MKTRILKLHSLQQFPNLTYLQTFFFSFLIYFIRPCCDVVNVYSTLLLLVKYSQLVIVYDTRNMFLLLIFVFYSE